MGSDVGVERASQFQEGNNFSILINTDSKYNADRFFRSLFAGGKVTLPMSKPFWGDYFGMFTDLVPIGW